MTIVELCDRLRASRKRIPGETETYDTGCAISDGGSTYTDDAGALLHPSRFDTPPPMTRLATPPPLSERAVLLDVPGYAVSSMESDDHVLARLRVAQGTHTDADALDAATLSRVDWTRCDLVVEPLSDWRRCAGGGKRLTSAVTGAVIPSASSPPAAPPPATAAAAVNGTTTPVAAAAAAPTHAYDAAAQLVPAACAAVERCAARDVVLRAQLTEPRVDMTTHSNSSTAWPEMPRLAAEPDPGFAQLALPKWAFQPVFAALRQHFGSGVLAGTLLLETRWYYWVRAQWGAPGVPAACAFGAGGVRVSDQQTVHRALQGDSAIGKAVLTMHLQAPARPARSGSADVTLGLRLHSFECSGVGPKWGRSVRAPWAPQKPSSFFSLNDDVHAAIARGAAGSHALGPLFSAAGQHGVLL
ncbi:hypothetical protein JKP88DRAFT_279596 [Tribonema minus]|uniref:Uncharacterized protein n=1 Tax=Tribonema minus TaxID=303371 RepID=A0A835YUT8_9STRA|nr:hypothetical protein JKP88DRAFT_279596 [Tribonema minus]